MKSYLKYVVELIVIVVGITLSFMVDEWREERKNRDKEIKAMKEILSGLKSDLIEIDNGYEKASLSLNSAEIILDCINDQCIFTDSIGKHISNMSFFLYSLPNNAPYENLKNEGLTIISNDSLRNKIIYYYEIEQKAWSSIVNLRADIWINMMDLEQENFSKLNWGDISQPVDAKSIMTDSRFHYYTNQCFMYRRADVSQYSKLRNVVKLLYRSVEDELQ